MAIVVGCSNEGEDVNQDGLVNSNQNNYTSTETLAEDQILFNENVITINRTNDNASELTDQVIECKREDLIFRTKKLETKYYLKNKGLKSEELNNAMEDLKSEQLFYFDFDGGTGENILKKEFGE